MESAERLKREVIKKIETAFANTPYPGSNIGDELEVGRFKRKKWKELNWEEARSALLSLHFFNSKARKYYMPAFLLAILRDPKRSLDLRLRIVEYFDPGEGWEKRERQSHGGLFNEKQRAAIRVFFDSYDQLFPPPQISWISGIEKERRDSLERCIKFWQKYG